MMKSPLEHFFFHKPHLLAFFHGLFLFFLTFSGDAAPKDSLLNALEKASSDTSKVHLYYELSKEFQTEDPYRSVSYIKKGLKLSDFLDFQKGKALGNEKLGIAYQRQGKFAKALDHYLASDRFFRKIGDKRAATRNLFHTAIIHYYQGSHEKARDYLKECEAEFRKQEKEKARGAALDVIGVTYKAEGELEEAREFHQEALSIRREIKDSVGMAKSLNNLGITYAMDGDFDQAIKYMKMALDVNQAIDNHQEIAVLHGNIGRFFLDKASGQDEADAEKWKIHGLTGKAIDHLEKSMEVAEKYDFNNERQFTYQYLSQAYKRLGEYQKSLEFHEKYARIKDTVRADRKMERIADLQSKYELEKKERENKLLKKEQKIQNQELRQQQLIIYGSSGAVILAIVVIMVVYRLYKDKKRTSLELEKLSIVASETDNSIFILSPSGELEWANRGFTQIFGYTLKEYKERYGSKLQDVSSNTEIQEKIRKCIEEKETVSYEAVNLTKDGRELWVQTTITPISKKDGSIRKLVAIDSDITRMKEAEATIRERNKEITDSISYARRIQNALLPTQQYFNSLFKDSFFLFKPQAIVSGDFYWAHELPGNKVAWVAADCTGHGVPGAFMSMIGNQLLNEIIIDKGMTEPGMIFDRMKESIVETLHKREKQEVMKDGMDATLCILDRETNRLWGVGANNPLYVIRKGIGEAPPEVKTFRLGKTVTMEKLLVKPFRKSVDGVELVPDKQAIGYEEGKDETFTTFEVQLQKEDVLYTFSDGYADQFGGPKGKKFRYGPFKQLLVEIHDKPMEEQKTILDQRFEAWKAETNQEQIDDVVVIGVRV